MKREWERLTLVMIVALYLGLGITSSLVVPIFEAPDEPSHFEYVRFIAQRRALPTEAQPGQPEHIQTAGHPPLYYVLGALLIGAIDTSDYTGWSKNPYFSYGPDTLGANVFVHSSAEDFPFRRTVLAVHLLRLMSLAFGAGTIIATYALAREFFPNSSWIAFGASALVAFLPQFIFISASVNSDSLVNFLAAVGMVQVARAARGELLRPRDFFLFGVTLGLANLAKASALVLLPLAAVAILGGPETRGWTLGLRSGGMVAAGFVGVAGWWYVRNQMLFGDPLALHWWDVAYASSGRQSPISVQEVVDFADAAWNSFWANFGWGNIFVNELVDRVLLMVTALAGFGWALRFSRREALPRGFWVLPLQILAVGTLFVWYWISFPEGGSQGRYMFTALPALAILFVYGLGAYLPRTRQWLVAPFCAGGFLIFATSIPLTVLTPAYQPFVPPVPLSERDVPTDATHFALAFNGAIGVYAFSTPAAFRPGASINVDLYWKALTTVASDNNVGLSLVASDGTVLWSRARRPGRGRSPTDLWKAGDIIPDTFVVRVPPDALTGRAVLRVTVAERDGEAWRTPQGETEPVLATVMIE